MSGHALATVVDDFPVTVDTYTASEGTTRRIYTRARIDIDEPGFRLHFGRGGVLVSLGKALGAQDIEIGDAGFDAGMVVKSNRPNLARAWLRGAAGHTVQRQPALTFAVEDGQAIVKIGAYLRERRALVAFVQTAAAFAGGGRALQARWSEAARELDGRPIAPFHVELLVPAGLVHIAADATRECTKVTLERVGGAPLEEILDAIEPDVAAWRAAIARLVAAAGPTGEPYR